MDMSLMKHPAGFFYWTVVDFMVLIFDIQAVIIAHSFVFMIILP